jgi:SAM-dependent methyltransferase
MMTPRIEPSDAGSIPCRKSVAEGDYFNALVCSRGEFNPFTQSGWNLFADIFDRMVAASSPVSILDVGCGTGQSRQIYIRHASSYVGIDVSEKALAVAREKFPESEWICADACAAPFEDGRFDVVAFSSVLHHIPDFTLALNEAMRLLKPGGIAFAFDPNLRHPAMALFRHPRSPFYLSEGVSPNERPLMPGALRVAFADSGFTDIRQCCRSGIPYRAVAPKLLNACISIYNTVDWLWAHLGLGRWFGVFVVTCAAKPGGGTPR